jgi:hypothetical protein
VLDDGIAAERDQVLAEDIMAGAQGVRRDAGSGSLARAMQRPHARLLQIIVDGAVDPFDDQVGRPGSRHRSHR